MGGYTKLFNKLLASSVWNEDLVTKVVWITVLAMKDQDNQVLGSVGGVAHQARVPIEECRKSLEKLMSPDSDDTSKVCEGRRLLPIQGGWFVVNGQYYRDAEDEDKRREQRASYMQRYRSENPDYVIREKLAKRRKRGVICRDESLSSLPIVTPSDQIRSDQREREDAQPTKYRAEIPIGLKTPEFESAWKEWFEYQSEGRRARNWNHASQRRDLVYLERLGTERACKSIDHTMGGKLDRLEEAVEIGSGPNGKSHQGAFINFVTREKVEDWCTKKKVSKMTDRAWGTLLSGKYYGSPITNEADFNAAMEAVKGQWMREA